MARSGACVLELELCVISCGGFAADGRLGEEERGKIQKGIWTQISKEKVCNVARHLVRVNLDVQELARSGYDRARPESIGSADEAFRLYLSGALVEEIERIICVLRFVSHSRKSLKPYESPSPVGFFLHVLSVG